MPSLKGQEWHLWPSSPRPDSVSHPPEDVIRLPPTDRGLFGEFPIHEEPRLTCCSFCGKTLKVEAFSEHFRQRHQEKRGIELPEEVKLSVPSPDDTHCVNHDGPTTNGAPKDIEVISTSQMVEETSLEQDAAKAEQKNDDSNVISIPDTEPLPHSSILSNDLMAMVAGETSAPPPPAPETMASMKKSLGSTIEIIQVPRKPSHQREFHPDRHCGVWDSEGTRQCTRALTCKSHSVLLKRKIEGRSKPFDELVAEHKAAKEALAAKAKARPNFDVEAVLNSLSQQQRLPHPPPSSPQVTAKMPMQQQVLRIIPAAALSSAATATPALPVSIQQKLAAVAAANKKGNRNHQPLHYTSEHPKPLAICTFGAKRLGSLIFTDRNQLLTRKVIRVALAKNRPKLVMRQDDPRKVSHSGPSGNSYLLNLNSSSRVATVNLSSLQVPLNISAANTSFKTDVQDFKGGMKFELGRKIQHIFPSTRN